MTILNTYDVLKSSHDGVIVVLFAIGVFIALCFAILSFVVRQKGLGIFFLIDVALLYVAIIACTMETPLYDYTVMEVMLDDSVPANEILGKYEIINKRGEIYELKYVDEAKVNAEN